MRFSPLLSVYILESKALPVAPTSPAKASAATRYPAGSGASRLEADYEFVDATDLSGPSCLQEIAPVASTAGFCGSVRGPQD